MTDILLALILVFAILSWVDSDPRTLRRIQKALRLGRYSKKQEAE